MHIPGLLQSVLFTLSVLATADAATPAADQPACSPTALSPRPKPFHCADPGQLQSPKTPIDQSTQNSVEACRDFCLSNFGCASFGYNSNTSDCVVYGYSLKQQKFKRNKQSQTSYWNIRCFKTCPPPRPDPPTVDDSSPTVDDTPPPTATAGAVAYFLDVTKENITASETKQALYGLKDDNGMVFYAIADFKAVDGSSFVSIESFKPFISSIECPDGDSETESITIIFNDREGYNYAQTWPSQFHMFTTTAALCGSEDGSRTFYHATSYDTDSTTKTVIIQVEHVPIEDAVGDAKVDFGSGYVSTSARQKRDGLNDIINFIAFWVGDSHSGSLSVHLTPKTFQAPYAPGDSDSGFDGGLYCRYADRRPDGSTIANLCGLYADIEIFGSIGSNTATVGFNLNNAKVVAGYAVSGHGFKLNLALAIAKVSLYSFVVEDVIDIELGASLIFDWFVSSDGDWEVNGIGGNITFPNLSLSLDTQGVRGSLSNRNGGSIVPQFSPETLSITYNNPVMSTGIWLGPKVAFTISVPRLTFIIPEFNAAIYFELPKFQLDIKQVPDNSIPGCTDSTGTYPAFLAQMNIFLEAHGQASGPGVPDDFSDVTFGVSQKNIFANKCVIPISH